MARPKGGPTIRIRLDGNIKPPAKDSREDKALQWYLAMVKERKAFNMAWEFIVAAVNGEMGPQVQAAVQAGDTAAAIEAAQDLFEAFVIE